MKRTVAAPREADMSARWLPGGSGFEVDDEGLERSAELTRLP